MTSSSRPELVPSCNIESTLGASNPTSVGVEDLPQCNPSNEFILAGLIKFKNILPEAWVAIAGRMGYHLLLMPTSPKTVQREIIIKYSGLVSIIVHCQPIFTDKLLLNVPVPPLVTEDEAVLQDYCKKGLSIITHLMDYDICIGANHDELRNYWELIPDTYVDMNPYREISYKETCRSVSCHRLVKSKGKASRCSSCSHVMKLISKRKDFFVSDSAHPHTPNVLLTRAQCLQKLKVQHDEIRKKDKKISYLQSRIENMLDVEGVDLDDDLNSDFSGVLSSSQLSPVQKMFFEEQARSFRKSDSRSHRWHPTMIRLALHLKMVSSAGYEALRDLGVIKLPSSRTLFDYSHAVAPQEGISEGIIKMVHERVKQMEKGYQKLHVILCDEMYISQNLVYRKSDNDLVGYAYLDEVEKEIQNFEKYVEFQFKGQAEDTEPHLAKTVVAFMIKGLASNVKYVVAAFPCKDLTSDLLYVWTWQVISTLETVGIGVLAFVCDGAPNNRAFIKMRVPLTKVESGVVFDTLNFVSPDERPLYFISDVCHLLKTIRNCFYNSGEGGKKTRCMEINGEKLVWKTIVRLYLTYKNTNFRKSFKLNAQNVFPNPFSCMKVRYAAQVLSDTVALDLEHQNWPNTGETIKFIRKCNKFFDCLNGAFSGQHIRSKNENLAPYTNINDHRFEWLLSFLDYLHEWKKQVDAQPIAPKEKEKRMLSSQTIVGIEMSIRAFIAATKYMLSLEEPAKFIMARVFFQDPLEQHFSLQRSGGGGSRNPNVSQFLSKQVSLAVQRDLGVRTRKSNVESATEKMELTDQSLPKRRKPSKK